ncbi:MAG TPA: helix-turn-helix transcriptional regulator [Thermoanaerobaculia bacterium]|nr:helix-turn-helix transcriptional regulator [Thermoanaerobaculia bacterium]
MLNPEEPAIAGDDARLRAVTDAAVYAVLSGFCIDAEQELDESVREFERYDDPQRRLGRRLRALRKFCRKSMGDLAEATGETVVRVSDIERGIGEPAGDDFVTKAAKYLGCIATFLEQP